MATVSSKATIPFLISMMLLTGVCNTLLTKYQDKQCVRNCASSNPRARYYFEQPVLQTLQMFIGEMGCWLVVLGNNLFSRYRLRNKDTATYSSIPSSDSEDVAAPLTPDADGDPIAKALTPGTDPEGRTPLTGVKVFLLALPACCDITGTTLMNNGLLFVAASIYQMTRGALVLFVGLFSVIFLRRHLFFYQWFALITVVVGVGIVGLAGALFSTNKAITPDNFVAVVHEAGEVIRRVVTEPMSSEAGLTILGVCFIAAAQIFTAAQFVLEEYILHRYALEPIKVVGWEGVFGFIVTLIGMIGMHFAVGRTDSGRLGYFDMVEGWREFTEYRRIFVSSVLIMISIGGFNFFGLSVTRTVSATSRSTIDTSRTLFIWIVSLALGWETFKWLQVVGFGLLVYGTFLFNDIIRPPLKRCMTREPIEIEEPINP